MKSQLEKLFNPARRAGKIKKMSLIYIIIQLFNRTMEIDIYVKIMLLTNKRLIINLVVPRDESWYKNIGCMSPSFHAIIIS